MISDQKVFISHGGSGFDWAERFHRHLVGRGVDAFLSPADFPYGDKDSANAMKEALRAMDVLVALVTAESAKSMTLAIEIGGAVGVNKPIIAVVPRGFDESKLPLFTRTAPRIVRETPEKTAEALLLAKAAA